MLNKVTLIGRLGRDPELRTTQSGTEICNFSVACSESWTDRASGQKKENTEWFRIVVFGRLAQNCNQYLAKGRKAYVDGKLVTKKWTDKTGQERERMEVHANNVVFLDQAEKKTETVPNYNFNEDFKASEIPF